jgi:hypothetical protein
MIVEIFNAQLLANVAKRPPEGKREYVIQMKNTHIHAEKVIIDNEEAEIGEKDLLVLEVGKVHFIEEAFDEERYVFVYKEARIYTKEYCVKEAIRDALDDAQHIVTWVTRPAE